MNANTGSFRRASPGRPSILRPAPGPATHQHPPSQTHLDARHPDPHIATDVLLSINLPSIIHEPLTLPTAGDHTQDYPPSLRDWSIMSGVVNGVKVSRESARPVFESRVADHRSR